MMGAIILAEYDSDWPVVFRFFRNRIADKLGGLAVAIEHIGSTAVPGLCAKPIIDIDVHLAREHPVSEAIERLAELGYRHEGDLGIVGREAFKAPDDDPPHHLYVCSAESQEFARHIAFRDYLRAHPQEAREYAELKKVLARKCGNDRNSYTAGKSEFIEMIMARALRGR